MTLERRRPEAAIPTASMADLAFLLIIVLLVTTVFSTTQGLPLELPRDADAPPELARAVRIQVGADRSVLVDCKAMALDDILPYLQPRLRHAPDKPVILYTDASATYGAMIAVYDVLRSATEEAHGFKVENVSVATQSEVRRYIGRFGFNPFEGPCSTN